MTKLRTWRLVVLLGSVLTVFGLAAFYIEFAANSRFDLIEHHYDAFGILIVLGTVVACVGCIAWATFCDRKHKAIMAAVVFFAPLSALLIGSPVDGMNMHGPSAITMMLMLPASFLSFVLLIMAAIGTNSRDA